MRKLKANVNKSKVKRCNRMVREYCLIVTLNGKDLQEV